MAHSTNHITLYDSTLRDGAQTQGVDFSVLDKQEIAEQLDRLGIDYIEGGWPGANPTDDAFFADLPNLEKGKITAFGMTRRPNQSVENDPGLHALLNTDVPSVCIVGKSWDFHVQDALEISLDENIALISDSVAHGVSKGKEMMFDAEHFFDGYKANPSYALACAKAAHTAGARWVILCDTNGGTLPHEVAEICAEMVKEIPGTYLGIHCHNDTENAVANSLAAVQAGVRQVQGTVNGYGERCGNANLIALIPTLKLKLGYDLSISDENMQQLTQIANALDDRLNRPRYRHAAYVGASAFAHKGGLHVSAVLKHPKAYEHVPPEAVGNERMILVSDQAGRSNVINRIEKIGLSTKNNSAIADLVDEIKQREAQGYAYDSADASFEVLARQHLEEVPEFYRVESFRVIDERRWNARNELVTFSEAKTHLWIGDTEYLEVAEGNGPVNALATALKKALHARYPVLQQLHLVDYKVRIIKPEQGTGAITRVQIEHDLDGKRFRTVGVSANIIDASFNALSDGFIYTLMHND